MLLTPSSISGAWLIEAQRFGDDRGWFQEWFKNSSIEKQTGLSFRPAQVNISHSSIGVIRGIHYSIAPHGQAKLVTVFDGEIDDYVVDIRKDSPTFGQWECVRLSANEGNSVLLGPYMAHAFQAVSMQATVCYAVSAEFNPGAEKAINPFCSTLNLAWNADLAVIVSLKDREAPDLLTQIARGEIPLWS